MRMAGTVTGPARDPLSAQRKDVCSSLNMQPVVAWFADGARAVGMGTITDVMVGGAETTRDGSRP